MQQLNPFRNTPTQSLLALILNSDLNELGLIILLIVSNSLSIINNKFYMDKIYFE